MRLARVLIADAPTPQAALERDGCLYDVERLEEVRDTRFAPDRFPNAGDFQTRAVALGCAGLEELDARLRLGQRPTEARLTKDAFVWLAPFDHERAMYVQLEGAGADSAPRYRIANARGVVGHDASFALPEEETRAEARLDIGVLLREELARATPAEARDAVLGFAILDDWTALDMLDGARAAGRSDAAARDLATQLGPLLVTPDEAEPLATSRAQLRVDDRVAFEGPLGLDLDALTDAIAALSHVVTLRPGDLVGAGLDLARAVAPLGARVDVLVERLGRLGGRAMRGPPGFKTSRSPRAR